MITKVILTTLAILACSPSHKNESLAAVQGIVNLDAKGFKKSLDATPEAIVVDVRTAPEVADGKIPGAINIDYNSADFDKKIASLDKSKPYYLYCKAGTRSSKAATKMKASGFTNIINLEGGYQSWVENGFKTVKP